MEAVIYNPEGYDNPFETDRSIDTSNICSTIQIAKTKKEKIILRLQCMEFYFKNYNCKLEDVVYGQITKEFILIKIKELLMSNIDKWSEKKETTLSNITKIYNVATEEEKYRKVHKMNCNLLKKIRF